MISSEEKELLALLQQDNKTALKAIFDRYHAPLCLLSYRIVGDQDDAKDVVQDVFFKLWKNHRSLNIQSSLFAYLKRAVLNTSLNFLEKQKRFSREEEGKSGEAIFAYQTADQQQLVNDLSLLAEKAIQELPPRTKVVFTLIRFEEMSYKQVAESLNISLKAVEKEMMKALQLLRQALKDYLPFLVLPMLNKAIHIILKFFS